MTGQAPAATALQVRRERGSDPADAAAIRAVHRAAFPTAAEAQLLDALQASGDYATATSLLAEAAGAIVGHCLLTAVTLVRADGTRERGRIVAIGPLGVLPAWQRRGVGGTLMRAALAHAESQGAAFVVLLGHPDYYSRFGFRPARAQGLLPPVAWRDVAWMALRLPAATPEDAGTIHYAQPFMAM